MLYEMITTVEDSDGVETITIDRLAEGDVIAHKEAFRLYAKTGASITHQVLPER